MNIKVISIVLILLLFGCVNQKKSTDFKKTSKDISNKENWHISSKNEWLINDGLSNVESIIYDQKNQVFYTSSGLGYGLGTSGFLSKISKNGNLEELKWVKNLNRPTGMAIQDSLLYVADVNSLVVINTRNGEIIEKYVEPIANSGLNDVAISENGEIYVSSSFKHSVLKLENGKLTVWVKDEEKLKWANGLLIKNKQLLVAGLNLCTIHTNSKEISVFELNERTKDFDGIVSDAEGGFFLTTVENSMLLHIDEQNNITRLKKSTNYFGDIDFIPETKELYIPRGNQENNEFYISVFKMGKSSSKNKN